jgi:hypothetical protein
LANSRDHFSFETGARDLNGQLAQSKFSTIRSGREHDFICSALRAASNLGD